MARYLPQAAWGQFDLLARAQPIERVLPRAPERLRLLLRQVPAIKAFASRHGLTISDNYNSYAELDREAAVWVVTASAPLALEADTWWFPGVGSFPYLGWFDPRQASRFADQLAQEGRDVYVRRVSAYSTLGWFRDPVLSTMLTRGRSVTGDFVNTVLHESVHATVYVDGQGTFNESLALFVADSLTPEYLTVAFGADSAECQAYLAAEKRRLVFHRGTTNLIAHAAAALFQDQRF
jgi:predicted aminopeptidase